MGAGPRRALFNAHYDDDCFHPIHIFEAATGKPVLSLLRPGNARLSTIGQPWREDAAVRRLRRGKVKLRRFFETGYRATSGPRQRRIIARVEATARGTDVRFVVTNPIGTAKVF